jgi:hypothetical protein
MENNKNTETGEGLAGENVRSSSEVVQVGALSQDESLLDMRFLFVEIRKKWWLTLIFLLLGGGLGAQELHSFRGFYMAKMVVAPIDSGNSAQENSGNSLVGALVGLDLGANADVSKFDQLVFSTSSQVFAKMLDDKYKLMDRFFGSAYDSETQSWMRPAGRMFEIQEQINNYFNFRLWTAPSLEDLAGYIGGAFTVEDITGTPFKQITFRHGNPDEALELLNLIYREAEALVKQKDEEEQKKKRQFLEQRYQETTILDFKQALVDMMADQARSEMVSHRDLPSVARIIEPPYVSKYKSEPNLARTLGVPMIGGGALGVAVILLMAMVRID